MLTARMFHLIVAQSEENGDTEATWPAVKRYLEVRGR